MAKNNKLEPASGGKSKRDGIEKLWPNAAAWKKIQAIKLAIGKFSFDDLKAICLYEYNLLIDDREKSGTRMQWVRQLFDILKLQGGHGEYATVAQFAATLSRPVEPRPSVEIE